MDASRLESLATFGLILSPALLHVLAYAGEGARGLRRLTFAALASLDTFLVVSGGLLALAPALLDRGDLPPLGPGMAPGADPAAMLEAIGRLGALTAGAGAVGLLLLVPTVRRAVARVLPIDAARPVHAVALHDVLLLIVMSGAIGLTLPIMVQDPEGLDLMSRSIAEAGLTGLWAQNAAFVLLALFGVGWLVARDGRAVVARLGLDRRPSVGWWLGASAAMFAASVALDVAWGALAPAQMADVERISEALIGPILDFGWAGALTIGLAAGIGEEILFRGAAQPRLGLVFTALLFAVMHTQYTVSPALALIFLLGLLLGTVRSRAGTWTAVAVHATYNFGIAALALLGG